MLTFGLVCVPSSNSIEKNLKTLKKYALLAKNQGCTALCFPECFLTGYLPREAVHLAVTKDSFYINEIARLSAALQMDLLVEFMELEQHSDIQTNVTEANRCYITHGLFLADGAAHFYRKTHLGSREKEYFSAGSSLNVFSLTCGMKIGFQICVETHFNDITQTLSLRGAQLIFSPHAVPRKAGSRQSIWEKYIPARSYDNKVYFACCNQWDAEKFGGGALVTDPAGEIIASFYGDQEQLLTSSIEESAVLPADSHPLRGKYYFPDKRRPDLYE